MTSATLWLLPLYVFSWLAAICPLAALEFAWGSGGQTWAHGIVMPFFSVWDIFITVELLRLLDLVEQLDVFADAATSSGWAEGSREGLGYHRSSTEGSAGRSPPPPDSGCMRCT